MTGLARIAFAASLRPRPAMLALLFWIAPLVAGAAPRTRVPGAQDVKEAAPAPAGPHLVSLEAGAGIGAFFASHAKLGVTLGRRFVRYLDLQATFHVVSGECLLGLEGALGAGLALPLKERWELVFLWRFGVASFRADLPGGLLWTGALVVSTIVEARYLLSRRWELHFAPVAVTGYWDSFWGVVLSPSLGAALRF